jgi:hypothetical protein
MRFSRWIGIATAAGMLSAVSAGAAFAADSDVAIDTTGADSNQVVKIDNSNKVTETNTNVVTVTNANWQDATSGDVHAAKNTSIGGGLGSGNAMNDNTTVTEIGINNTVPVVVGGNGEGSQVGTGGSGAVETPGVAPEAGGKGGSVLGASTAVGGMGGGVLPEVGASSPIDVSALRAAWQPQTMAPTSTLADRTAALRMVLFVLSGILCLAGAAMSIANARRSAGRA